MVFVVLPSKKKLRKNIRKLRQAASLFPLFLHPGHSRRGRRHRHGDGVGRGRHVAVPGHWRPLLRVNGGGQGQLCHLRGQDVVPQELLGRDVAREQQHFTVGTTG